MAIPPRPTLRDLDAEEKVSLADALGDTEKRLTVQGQDFTAADMVPIPKREDLETPESAADWAQKELVRATPRAVQELVHQLRKGDSKARAAAALQILERAGVQAKQERVSQAPVIVLTPKVIQMLPWLKSETAKVVDGEVVVKKGK